MKFGTYRPDDRGLSKIGSSSKLHDSCMPAAEKLASWARTDDPDGSYRAEPAAVTAGWNNEVRSGARVIETVQGRGAEKRTLVRGASRRS